jgi:hypothetical protein
MRQINVDKTYIERASKKPSKDLKMIERFVLKIAGDYGCKEFYTFKELKEYNAADNFVASDKVISSDGDDY